MLSPRTGGTVEGHGFILIRRRCRSAGRARHHHANPALGYLRDRRHHSTASPGHLKGVLNCRPRRSTPPSHRPRSSTRSWSIMAGARGDSGKAMTAGLIEGHRPSIVAQPMSTRDRRVRPCPLSAEGRPRYSIAAVSHAEYGIAAATACGVRDLPGGRHACRGVCRGVCRVCPRWQSPESRLRRGLRFSGRDVRRSRRGPALRYG